jgi:streptomycin 6-kinase
MNRVVRVPDALRRKAAAEGAACMRWLAELGDLIDELEREWGIVVGGSIGGGTASFVARATAADGTPAVIKLGMPAALDGREALELEVRALLAAAGRGCVRVLSYDPNRGAVLLERLGRQLAELELPLSRQFAVICETLDRLWTVPAIPDLPSGADKGRWLASFIVTTWQQLSRPCPVRVIDHAMRLSERRTEAFDPERAVLVHGDAHAWNTLEDPRAADEFRLVDPDGLFAEPEYDLAIPMREHNDELLAGDPLRLGRERAQLLARQSGLDEQRIWEWGYLERVSTGLLLMKLDKDVSLGQVFLEVADVWARG